MSYDIYFVRRDPGQTFEDALDDLESSFAEGEETELTDSDLEMWETLLPRAHEILGDIDILEEDETTRGLTARSSGGELTLISGELEIHVPTPPPGVDDLELMSTVYELARVVEDATGLEGYDPQAGQPISDALNEDSPTRRRWPDEVADDEDEGPAPAPQRAGGAAPVADPRPDMAPDAAEQRPRRWWEFWRT